MKHLPITQEEYAQSVLLADFIRKIKSVFQSSDNISGIKFVPLLKGYDILFTQNASDIKISLTKDDSDSMYVVKYADGKPVLSFFMHNADDNSVAINKIFSSKK